MSYVIYRRSDSKVYVNRKTGTMHYDSPRSVKAALTRLENSGKIDRTEYDFAEYEYYCDNIEQYVTVKNLMSGKPVRQSVNTPLCCDPSSETYWSM